MIWVVAMAREGAGMINGASQSAKNLLEGLAALGVEHTPLWLLVDPAAPAGVAPPPGEPVRLRPVASWSDPGTVATLRAVAGRFAPGDVVHLLEVHGYIGAWLEVLRDHPAVRVAFTGLDYFLACQRTNLLRWDGRRCDGRVTAADCRACLTAHREPLKHALTRAVAAVPRLPVPGLAARWAGLRAGWEFGRRTVEGRFAARPADFARLDALVAPSRALGEHFAGLGFPADRIHYVRYGTAAGAFLPVAQRPGWADGPLRLAFMGRLAFDKGPDLLFDALRRLRARGITNFEWTLYASRDTGSAAYRALIRRLDAEPWVRFDRFDGSQPAGIDAAHRDVHLLVMPSRWTDNLPNVGLEAVLRGTPILAPDQGSLREIVTAGDNGFLYPEQPGALEAALAGFVADRAPLAALPFAARPCRPPLEEAADIAGIYAHLAA